MVRIRFPFESSGVELERQMATYICREMDQCQYAAVDC